MLQMQLPKPQSLPFSCCWTGTLVTPWKLPPNRLFTCSSTSFSIMLLNSLSYKLTNPGGQLMKLTHTQCDLPMCRIWTNSLVIIEKFLTGPSVSLWNPLIKGFTFYIQIWHSCITSQSSQPASDRIVSWSLASRFPKEPTLYSHSKPP